MSPKDLLDESNGIESFLRTDSRKDPTQENESFGGSDMTNEHAHRHTERERGCK